MNILYYCVEYHQSFGASTHAREFFAGLQQINGAGKCNVVPDREGAGTAIHRPVAAAEASLKRKVARLLIPRWLRLILLFLRPPKTAWEVLSRELNSGEWDALIMRPGWATMWIPKLKRHHPHVKLLLEINSAMFDEGFKEVPGKWFWKRLEARVLNSSDWVTTVSENLKEYLVRYGVDGQKILVNPNGVNLQVFDPSRYEQDDKTSIRDKLGVSRETMLFGYVGGMQPFRRLPDVVEIFCGLLASRNLNATLLLVGDGLDMELVQEARTRFPAAIQQRILITGSRPYDEIPGIVSSFDVAIFPFSNPYGSPQKLFEYMAMGIPVIGPRVPVVEETFRDNEHLLLTEADDGASFRQLVLTCMEDPESLQQMAITAQEYVKRDYTWRKNAERVFALLGQNT